nr:BPK_HP1_G0058250.mRNA.1.CDS.1 [Saccharomyces cerevisiae]
MLIGVVLESNFQGDGEDAPDLDWGAARGSNLRSKRREKEFDIGWTAARGSNFQGSSRPPREREKKLISTGALQEAPIFKLFRPPRRKKEPDIDWSAARGSKSKLLEATKEKEKSQILTGVQPGVQLPKLLKTTKKKRKGKNQLWIGVLPEVLSLVSLNKPKIPTRIGLTNKRLLMSNQKSRSLFMMFYVLKMMMKMKG